MDTRGKREETAGEEGGVEADPQGADAMKKKRKKDLGGEEAGESEGSCISKRQLEKTRH